MTSPETLPPPPGAPEPVLPTVHGAGVGFGDVASLVGQTIEVTTVGDLNGIPFIVVDGAPYLCEGEWVEACATRLDAEFKATNAESFTVQVVDVNGHVGFAPAG